jgi:hypothetical protein
VKRESQVRLTSTSNNLQDQASLTTKKLQSVLGSSSEEAHRNNIEGVKFRNHQLAVIKKKEGKRKVLSSPLAQGINNIQE